MRVEVRASGGDACERCGALPLIHTPTNGALEADLTELLTRTVELAIADEGVLLKVVASRREKFELEMRERRHAFERSVADLLAGDRPSWYRPLKRRWHEGVLRLLLGPLLEQADSA